MNRFPMRSRLPRASLESQLAEFYSVNSSREQLPQSPVDLDIIVADQARQLYSQVNTRSSAPKNLDLLVTAYTIDEELVERLALPNPELAMERGYHAARTAQRIAKIHYLWSDDEQISWLERSYASSLRLAGLTQTVFAETQDARLPHRIGNAYASACGEQVRLLRACRERVDLSGGVFAGEEALRYVPQNNFHKRGIVHEHLGLLAFEDRRFSDAVREFGLAISDFSRGDSQEEAICKNLSYRMDAEMSLYHETRDEQYVLRAQADKERFLSVYERVKSPALRELAEGVSNAPCSHARSSSRG